MAASSIHVDVGDGASLGFITYLDAPQQLVRDSTLRSIVRHRASQPQRWAPVQSETGTTARNYSVGQQRSLMRRFRVQSKTQQQTRKSQRHRADVAAPNLRQPRALDPFVSALGASAWRLLHYFRYFFRQNSVSINGKKDWFSFFISDEATAHATLALISLNNDFENGNQASATTLHHKNAALRLARLRLLNGGVRELEALTGTIATLLLIESLDFDLRSAEAHIRGLQHLVRLSGGVQSLSKNEALLRIIGWADLSFSRTWPYEPSLPRIFITAQATEDCNKVCLGWSSPRAEPTYLTADWTAFYIEVAQLIEPELLVICKLFHDLPNKTLPETLSEDQRQLVSRAVYTVERNLVEYTLKSQSLESHYSFSRIFSLAGLLYTAIALRDLPVQSKSVGSVAKALDRELSSRISEVYLSHGSNASLILLLWACMVRLAAVPTSDSSLSLTLSLRRILVALDIHSAEILLGYLRYVTWSESLLAKTLSNLFAQRPSNLLKTAENLSTEEFAR